MSEPVPTGISGNPAFNGRVLFPILSSPEPRGGANVLIDHANALVRRGVAAHPVYANSGLVYTFREPQSETFIFPKMMATEFSLMRGKRKTLRKLSRIKMYSRYSNLLEIRKTDIIVIPEFYYDKAAKLFPDNVKILAVQDVFGLLSAYRRGGRPSVREFPFAFSTSNASTEALSKIYDGDRHRISLEIESEKSKFQKVKSKKIALLSRKRKEESDILVRMIGDFLPDWEIREIQGTDDDEKNAILRESAIFLSLSREEGFGLPPAEAMLSGCLVVGYDGVGGGEYMSDETCIPIKDGDVVSLFAAMEKAAKDYDANGGEFSERYEKTRRSGFSFIDSKYNRAEFQRSFDAFWDHVFARLARPIGIADGLSL